LIDRRRLIGALVGTAVSAPLVATVQSKDKVWRIGLVGFALPGASATADRSMRAFVRELADRGFVEGKNMVLELRPMAGEKIKFRHSWPS
jgi:hypothetical protein